MSNKDDAQSFIQLYGRPTEPVDDDQIARQRIGEFINNEYVSDRFTLATECGMKLGVRPKTWSSQHYTGIYWVEFINGLTIPQFLSIVTIFYQFDALATADYVDLTKSKQRKVRATKCLNFCRQVFVEHGLNYNINDNGAVRYQIDEKFEQSKQATVSELSDKKFGEALRHLVAAYDALSEIPGNTRLAVREIFDCAETISKIVVTAPKLTATVAVSDLYPIYAEKLATDETAKRSASKLFRSFGEWIDSVHFYRHAAKPGDGTHPDRSAAIYMVEIGTTYVRLLASMANESELQ